MTGRWMMAPMALTMALLMTAGCLEELVDPQMDIKVLEAKALDTAPALVNDTLGTGNEYLYIRVNLTSENEDVDQWVNPNEFTVDANGTKTYPGLFMANMEMRSIGRMLVDAGTSKTFWLVFEVPGNVTMLYLRFEGTADEPVEVSLPAYSHLD